MRVHPSILAPKITRRQVSIGLGVIAFLLLVNLVAYPRKQVVTQANKSNATHEKLIEVVVARGAIEPGQSLEKADIVLEQRPVSTLPSDVITNFDALKNKVAAGPIPARYPISLAFLAEPVAVAPPPPVQESAQPAPPEDPIEMLLREIERDSVAVTVGFTVEAPPRGSRLALSVPKGNREPVLIVEDCWVSKANGREATLRMEPDQALVVQAAKPYGSFNFIELPFEGASPFAGTGVGNVEELKARIEGKPIETKVDVATNKKKPIGKIWNSDDPTSKLCIYADNHTEPCTD